MKPTRFTERIPLADKPLFKSTPEAEIGIGLLGISDPIPAVIDPATKQETSPAIPAQEIWAAELAGINPLLGGNIISVRVVGTPNQARHALADTLRSIASKLEAADLP